MNEVENQLDKRITILRIHEVYEYMSRQFEELCNAKQLTVLAHLNKMV